MNSILRYSSITGGARKKIFTPRRTGRKCGAGAKRCPVGYRCRRGECYNTFRDNLEKLHEIQLEEDAAADMKRKKLSAAEIEGIFDDYNIDSEEREFLLPRLRAMEYDPHYKSCVDGSTIKQLYFQALDRVTCYIKYREDAFAVGPATPPPMAACGRGIARCARGTRCKKGKCHPISDSKRAAQHTRRKQVLIKRRLDDIEKWKI